MKLYSADTNFFLRYLLNDVPHQADEAEKWLTEAKKKKITIYVSQIVLFEITFVLNTYYHFTKEEIIDKTRLVLGASYVTIEDKDIFGRALLLYEKTKLSFVDSFIISEAMKRNAEVLSFDKDLKEVLASSMIQ